MTYGLISETDGRTLEKTIDLICDEFKESKINILEVGIYGGETGNGLRWYLKPKNREIFLTGIDSNKDGEPIRYYYNRFIEGKSNEVYNQLEDNSQHLIFLDACHCFAHVISDFFCYAPKVKVGGYLAFHDTGRHIKPFKDFQHGDKENPDAYISVRKALDAIGMFGDAGYDLLGGGYVSKRYMGNFGWRLWFDEADENNEAGGIIVFKKRD